MAVRVVIHGIPELQAKLASAETRLDGPARTFLNRASVIQEEVQKRAPVDTRRLRDSIIVQVERRKATVYSGLDYARHVEFGTRPHFPPPSALEGWARRHGFGPGGGFLVARAISRTGTKAHHFMRDGAEASKPRIVAAVPTLAADIEAAFAAG